MFIVKINKFLYSKYSTLKVGNILIEEFLLECNLKAAGFNETWACFYFDRRLEALEVHVKFMQYILIKELEVNFDKEVSFEHTSDYDTPFK